MLCLVVVVVSADLGMQSNATQPALPVLEFAVAVLLKVLNSHVQPNRAVQYIER